MFFDKPIITVVLSLVAAVTSIPLEARAPPPCAANVHMIMARASNANRDGGVLLDLAQSIQRRITDSNATNVPYPATVVDYPDSVSKGSANLRRMLQSYVDRCPETAIVLLGYSQGAQVVGDMLIGNPAFTDLGVLPESYRNASEYRQRSAACQGVPIHRCYSPLTAGTLVVAIIQMGDPTHVPGLSYDVGTSMNNGVSIAAYTYPPLPSRCDY